MAQESLIPEESLAMVGQVLGNPQTATITRREAQRYAWAAGDPNLIYFEEDAAKDAGYPGLVAPPTILGSIMEDGGPVDSLRSDGLYKGRKQGVPLRVKRVMFGGQEWDFLAPVLVGDTIRAEMRVKSVEQKAGDSGPFVLTTLETTYTNQDAEVVARTRQVSIAR